MSDKISPNMTYKKDGAVYVVDDKQLNRLARLFALPPEEVRRIISIVGPETNRIGQYIQDSKKAASSTGLFREALDSTPDANSINEGPDTNFTEDFERRKQTAMAVNDLIADAGSDPLARAKVYLKYGLNNMARIELADALQTDQHNMEIRDLLATLPNLTDDEGKIVFSSDALDKILHGESVGDERPMPSLRYGVRADQGPTKTEGPAPRDALNRGKITTALAQLITRRTNVAPFAIGLFGHWGSGKSSQIDFVKTALSEINEPAIICVTFNAWEHEKSDNMGAALAQTVVESLVKDLGFIAQVKLSVHLALRRQGRLFSALNKDRNNFSATIIKYAFFGIPYIVPTVIVPLFAYTVLSISQSNAITGIGTLAVSAVTWLLTLQKFVAKNLTEWFKSINSESQSGVFRPLDFTHKLGSFHEIHQTLKHLCEISLTGLDSQPEKGSYLLLVVDDLDRCGPQTVKQVFDAVRLVAHIPRVVTLVALDERIAYSAVEKHFDQFESGDRELAQVARDYLAKVFQVAFTLPPVVSNICDSFIRDELFGENIDKGSSKDKLRGNLETDELQREELDNPKSELADGTTIENRIIPVLEEEIDNFTKLAKITNMSNPRQLWRIKQAWFLLKGLVLDDGDSFEIMKPWMQLLFCREWLLHTSTDIRNEIEMYVSGTYTSGPSLAILDQKDASAVINLLNRISLDNWAIVDAVLLPASSSGRKTI